MLRRDRGLADVSDDQGPLDLRLVGDQLLVHVQHTLVVRHLRHDQANARGDVSLQRGLLDHQCLDVPAGEGLLRQKLGLLQLDDAVSGDMAVVATLPCDVLPQRVGRRVGEDDVLVESQSLQPITLVGATGQERVDQARDARCLVPFGVHVLPSALGTGTLQVDGTIFYYYIGCTISQTLSMKKPTGYTRFCAIV